MELRPTSQKSIEHYLNIGRAGGQGTPERCNASARPDHYQRLADIDRWPEGTATAQKDGQPQLFAPAIVTNVSDSLEKWLQLAVQPSGGNSTFLTIGGGETDH